MMYATDNGHLAVVQLLVSSGADTNIQNKVSYIYTTPTQHNKHDETMMVTMTCTNKLLLLPYSYIYLIFLNFNFNF